MTRPKLHSALRLAFVSLIVLAVSACTTVVKDGNKPVASTDNALPQDASLLSDGSIRHDTSNARVANLWANAEESRFLGNQEEANRYILQAIELQPRDSVLLSRAAELQLELNQPVIAESYAVRSNSFAEANRALLLRNWMIIEHAREMRGDLLGVRTAHRKVQQFQL